MKQMKHADNSLNSHFVMSTFHSARLYLLEHFKTTTVVCNVLYMEQKKTKTSHTITYDKKKKTKLITNNKLAPSADVSRASHGGIDTWWSSGGSVFRATMKSWLILPALQIPHLVAIFASVWVDRRAADDCLKSQTCEQLWCACVLESGATGNSCCPSMWSCFIRCNWLSYWKRQQVSHFKSFIIIIIMCCLGFFHLVLRMQFVHFVGWLTVHSHGEFKRTHTLYLKR